MRLSLCIVAIYILLGIVMGFMDNEENKARELYLDAKKKCIEQKWSEAIALFKEFLEKYPDSRYRDDAKFWVGYAMEKSPGMQSEAFLTYADLVTNHPGSAWVDDAQIHQIILAERFVGQGLDQYKAFLLEKLQSDLVDVCNRAAISLGRLGDKRALSVLKELESDQDLGGIASALIPILEREQGKDKVDTLEQDLRVVYDIESKPLKKVPDKGRFLWFSSKRYDQYRSMLKKDDDWSKQELYDFALWHIVDTDEFEEYRAFTNEYDKREWIRKYWKQRDPTPTTEENELIEEFETRVLYARAHFSDYWNYRHFNYLPDQYLRQDVSHAPWDARGELYIKFGAPDVRSIHGWQTEEWIYYSYSVDFLVKQYMTNIYGNAIGAGEMTLRLHEYANIPRGSLINDFAGKDDVHIWNLYNSYLQANFIYNNELRFEYNYKADPIEDFELAIDVQEGKPEAQLILRYRVPADEFKLKKSGGRYRLKYNESCIVLNEDLREIKRYDVTKELDNIVDDDDAIEERIEMKLPPGDYTFHIRIDDLNSDKLGIYTQKFTLKK